MMRGLVSVVCLCALAWANEPDGAIAAPARWTGPNGPASHSRRSRAMPVTRDVVEAWAVTLPGQPVAPPVTWDGLAYVLWRQSNRFRGPPAVSGDCVLVLGHKRGNRVQVPTLYALRRSDGTCVHELTHHWLNEYNPRATGRHGPGLPGFWIVEGFATFMEEGIYDVESGEWNLFNPRSRCLDVMQAAKPKQLIPWKALYALQHIGFNALPVASPQMVVLRWNLEPVGLTPRRLFYEQAGATCQLLYHGENGNYRQPLLDYVCSYYSARAPELDPKKAFGLDAEELGRRTVQFARAVAGGWRPQ